MICEISPAVLGLLLSITLLLLFAEIFCVIFLFLLHRDRRKTLCSCILLFCTFVLFELQDSVAEKEPIPHIPDFGRQRTALPVLFLLLFSGLTLWELLKLPKRFRVITELENAMTAVSDAMGEKLIYEPMERGRERREAFDQRHPAFAEKSREYAQEVLARRSELNADLKERKEESKAALAEKRDELETRLRELRQKHFVYRRIVRAYPALLEGRHNGRNFRRLGEQKDEDKKAS